MNLKTKSVGLASQWGLASVVSHISLHTPGVNAAQKNRSCFHRFTETTKCLNVERRELVKTHTKIDVPLKLMSSLQIPCGRHRLYIPLEQCTRPPPLHSHRRLWENRVRVEMRSAVALAGDAWRCVLQLPVKWPLVTMLSSIVGSLTITRICAKPNRSARARVRSRCGRKGTATPRNGIRDSMEIFNCPPYAIVNKIFHESVVDGSFGVSLKYVILI